MRSNEERVAAVKARIAEKEKQKKKHLSRAITVSSMAASIALIVVLSGIMPGMIQRFDTDRLQKYKAAASIFGNGAGSGYIMIALIAFVLGICVTVFCFRVRRYLEWNKQTQNDQEGKDD